MPIKMVLPPKVSGKPKRTPITLTNEQAIKRSFPALSTITEPRRTGLTSAPKHLNNNQEATQLKNIIHLTAFKFTDNNKIIRIDNEKSNKKPTEKLIELCKKINQNNQ